MFPISLPARGNLGKRMTPPDLSATRGDMRMFPRIFLVLLALALPALAEDWTKKDPEAIAKEARKIAADLRKEADYLQTRAFQEGRALSADEKKYVTYTLEEADLLQKSYEAWDKNQKRMAEKFREKASEFCHKRGEMAGRLKLWEEKKPSLDDKKGGDKTQSEKAAKLAEIENQQAELERKKKELQESPSTGL